ERDHPEALAHRGDDDDRRPLDRALDRADVAEEVDRMSDAELAHERLQRRLERTAPGHVELELGEPPPRLGERAQEHEMALDRDQPPDAKQPRRASRVGARLAVGVDAVVDDLEALAVEAL